MNKYNTPSERLIGRFEDRGKPGFTKLGLPRKKLGRPRNLNKDLPLEEQRRIYREMHRNGIILSAEQTAIAMWNPEIETKPMTKAAVLKIEQRALAKLKMKLAKLGIKSLDDVFTPNCEEVERTVVMT